MTNCTPAQARQLAKKLSCGLERYAPLTESLHSLADQVEVLTAKNVAMSNASLDLLNANDVLRDERNILRAERDVLVAAAARYLWMYDRFIGADFDWNESGTQVLVIEWPGGPVYGDLDITIEGAMKEPK